MAKNHIGLVELADLSGIPTSSLNSYGKGGKLPSLFSLVKICEFFHITLAEFFYPIEIQNDITKKRSEIAFYLQRTEERLSQIDSDWPNLNLEEKAKPTCPKLMDEQWESCLEKGKRYFKSAHLYNQVYQKLLSPAYGKRKLVEISSEDITQFITKQSEKRAKASLNQLLCVLSFVYREAQKDYQITNPVLEARKKLRSLGIL